MQAYVRVRVSFHRRVCHRMVIVHSVFQQEKEWEGWEEWLQWHRRVWLDERCRIRAS